MKLVIMILKLKSFMIYQHSSVRHGSSKSLTNDSSRGCLSYPAASWLSQTTCYLVPYALRTWCALLPQSSSTCWCEDLCDEGRNGYNFSIFVEIIVPYSGVSNRSTQQRTGRERENINNISILQMPTLLEYHRYHLTYPDDYATSHDTACHYDQLWSVLSISFQLLMPSSSCHTSQPWVVSPHPLR